MQRGGDPQKLGGDSFVAWAADQAKARETAGKGSCGFCGETMSAHPTSTCKITQIEITRPRSNACANCGAAIENVGLCRTCGGREIDREKRAKIRGVAPTLSSLGSGLLQIPRDFRWARLDSDLLAQRCEAHKVRIAADWAGRLLVLRGSTTAGKTSIAAALLTRAIESGIDGAWWINCEDVSPDAPRPDQSITLLDRAMFGSFVVLDDLGQDLSGAPEGGGIAAIRGERMRRVIRFRHREGMRTIVTVGLSDAQIKGGYGDDILSRLTVDRDDSTVIRLLTRQERA